MTINKHGFDIPFAWCTRNPATSTIFLLLCDNTASYTRGMLIEYNLVIISNNINPVVIFKPFFFTLMCNVQIPTLIIMYVDRTHVYDRIIDVH